MSATVAKTQDMDRPRGCKDLFPSQGVPASLDGATRDQIDLPPEESREVVLDGDVVEETPFCVGEERDEEVDIAPDPGFAASDGAEHVELRDLPATTHLLQPCGIDLHDDWDRRGSGAARHARIIRARGDPLPDPPRYGGHGRKASEPSRPWTSTSRSLRPRRRSTRRSHRR